MTISSREYFIKLVLIILIFSACLIFTRNVELTNAWNGWSPVGFTWALEDNHLRDQRDFYHFVFKRDHLLNSIANWIYPFNYNYFSIEPPITQIAFIVATTFFYSFTIIYFLNTFVKGPCFLVSATFAVALALFTNVINCNLARFGQANLSLGQSYGVAIPLQLAALTMTLRKRLLWAWIALGFLNFVHISIGFITAFVVVAMALSCSGQWKRPGAIAGLTILSICSVAWALYLSQIFDSTSNVMNLKEWIDWERMMNYHYFPFDTGIFTTIHYQGISPFLNLLLVAFSSNILSKLSVTALRMWLVGIIVSVLIALCGLIISIYPPSITAVMLALHRASGITLLLLLPIATWHIVDLFCSKDFLSPIVGLACIMPVFLQKTWGIPIIPSLFVAALAFYNKNIPLPNWQKKILTSLFIIIIGYACFLCAFDYAKPSEPSILGDRYVFLMIFFMLLIWVATIKFKKFKANRDRIYNIIILLKHSIMPWLTIVAITLLVASSICLNFKKYPAVDVNLARAYLDAQLWAKSSTDPKAVFMGDPGMPVYGRAWTEYSRRASFGSVRDWLHIPIVYHADLNGFKEGVRRLSLLGVDPYTFKKSAFSSPDIMPMVEHTKTIDAARAAYYSMSPDSLIDLASREGINFFIFMKNYIKPHPNLARVFENNHFVILAPQYASMKFNTN